MNERIVLESLADMTLSSAERVAFDEAEIVLGENAKKIIARGRERFEAYLARNRSYVYGSPTAPGSRAKVLLTEQASLRQGETLRGFISLEAGVGGEMLPARCVRLAAFARLSNAMTGSGKLRPGTAEAVAALVKLAPRVPMHAVACSGEVMPLSWLMAPLADLPLSMGEAMALINGSPFATAMACDVALTASRRLQLAEWVFALSIEVSQCPAAHFDGRLGQCWPDRYYGESLLRLEKLLAGSRREELKHQAPTSWRLIPNILASVRDALAAVSSSARLGLQSLKDNPTFLQDARDPADDAIVSAGGYHDHRAAKAIDQVNSALVDVCVLASRQVGHFLDGGSLGLPPLLARDGDGVGAEYLAWGMTEPLATARRAAEASTLDVSLQDPAGNQSDIASVGFQAYEKHRAIARAYDACLASLAITVSLARDFRTGPLPRSLSTFAERLATITSTAQCRIDVVGKPLRQFRTLLTTCAEDMTTAAFAAFCRAPVDGDEPHR